MHIPKSALFAVALIGAAFAGWTLHTSAGASSTAPQLATEVAARHANQRPVQLTVVMPEQTTVPGSSTPEATPTLRGSARSGSTTRTIHSVVRPGEQVAATPTSVNATTNLRGPAEVQGLSVIANGDHIVIANDGSIISVGDNTVVKGNTGDAGASGSIAVDVDDSELTTGSSGLSAPTPQTTPGPGSSTTNPETQGAVRQSAPPSPRSRPSGPRPPGGAPTGGGACGVGPGTRAVGLAGYEVHAVEVTGNENLLTYDDSNLFFHRIGTMNGNTGDTDTSGLNVVDSERSVVRTGDSGNSDETPDPPPFNPASLPPAAASAMGAAPSGCGSSVSIADVNGVSSATGDDALVIGGDGFDDNGVRVHGDRNVATYDDGNVAIGGLGDVNSQIGDSDTSGAVVMRVRDSNIRSGDSFLPADQQAGAQVGDPFDGDDPDVSEAGTPGDATAPVSVPSVQTPTAPPTVP